MYCRVPVMSGKPRRRMLSNRSRVWHTELSTTVRRHIKRGLRGCSGTSNICVGRLVQYSFTRYDNHDHHHLQPGLWLSDWLLHVQRILHGRMLSSRPKLRHHKLSVSGDGGRGDREQCNSNRRIISVDHEPEWNVSERLGFMSCQCGRRLLSQRIDLRHELHGYGQRSEQYREGGAESWRSRSGHWMECTRPWNR